MSTSYSCSERAAGPLNAFLIHSNQDREGTTLALIAFEQPIAGLALLGGCLRSSDDLFRPSDASNWYPQQDGDRGLGSATGDEIAVTDGGHLLALRLGASGGNRLDQLRVFTESPELAPRVDVECDEPIFTDADNASVEASLGINGALGNDPGERFVLVELPTKGVCTLNGNPCRSVGVGGLVDSNEMFDLEPFERFQSCSFQSSPGQESTVNIQCSWPGGVGPVTMKVLGARSSPSGSTECEYQPNEPEPGEDAGMPAEDASVVDAATGDATPVLCSLLTIPFKAAAAAQRSPSRPPSLLGYWRFYCSGAGACRPRHGQSGLLTSATEDLQSRKQPAHGLGSAASFVCRVAERSCHD